MPVSKFAVVTKLLQHQPYGTEEGIHLVRTRQFLSESSEPLSRNTLAGHVTASAWVLSPDRQSALLIHHKKLDRWFQPGGHIETEDDSIIAACRREVAEECGITDLLLLSENIFDVDVHEIPASGDMPAHLHYDLRYIFGSETSQLAPDLSEVKATEWVNVIDWLRTNSGQGSVGRMMAKTLDHSYLL